MTHRGLPLTDLAAQISRSGFLKLTHRPTQACLIRGGNCGCRRRIALHFSHDTGPPRVRRLSHRRVKFRGASGTTAYELLFSFESTSEKTLFQITVPRRFSGRQRDAGHTTNVHAPGSYWTRGSDSWLLGKDLV